MTYTNILQSYVVVPQVRLSGISFEDMIKQGYAFQSNDWTWIKAISADAGFEGMESTRTREKLLSERVSKREKHLEFVLHLNEFVSFYSETAKRVMVETRGETGVHKLASKAIGWDMIVGTEQLFTVPLWWVFQPVERASLLVNSLETLKETGFMGYFLQLSDSKYRKAAYGGHVALSASSPDSALDREKYEGISVSLEDSLAYESFVLFLYGIALATTFFMFESCLRVGKRIHLSLKRKNEWI